MWTSLAEMRIKQSKWITLLTSKCFFTDVWIGKKYSVLLLLCLLWTDLLVGISSLYLTFPGTNLWPWTLCRSGERNCSSYIVQILIWFRNILRYINFFFFLGWQELWLYWQCFLFSALWKVTILNINHKVIVLWPRVKSRLY